MEVGDVDVVYNIQISIQEILVWGGVLFGMIAALSAYIYNRDWGKQDAMNERFSNLHDKHLDVSASLDRNLAVLTEVVNRKLAA